MPDDTTPPIREQAAAKGWLAGFWNFGKAEQPGVDFLNPGLVRRHDGLFLLVRRSEAREGMSFGFNQIWACKLNDEDYKTPVGGPPLQFPDSTVDEQFEDPRAIHWNGQTWVGACNFIWFPNGTWTGAHQCLGVFGDDPLWTPIARRDPPVGTNTAARGHTNGKHNKNLLWWFIDDKLYCLYTSDPWLIVEFGNSWKEQKHHTSSEQVRWKYGWVRGGTPPVQIGDLFYTFFHSSLPWQGRFRRYYMGAIAFEAKPPFRPKLWTQEPILVGSQNDHWSEGKPLVVFPCGAIHEGDRWIISLGVNDLKCAWLELPHDDLLQLLSPAPVMPGMSLLAEQTIHPSIEPIPFIDKPDEGPREEVIVATLAKSFTEIVPEAERGDQYWSDINLSGGVESRNATEADSETELAKESPSISRSGADTGGTPSEEIQLKRAPDEASSESGASPAPNSKLEAQRARMAKARIAMAEKRAAGTLVRKPRKKRHKKKALKPRG